MRDLLLGNQPKDFDVATDATPEEVRELFRNSRIIGRRFKIVHVRFGREIIEVTTFRGHHDGDEAPEKDNKRNNSRQAESGMLLRDNVYGSLEEDAMRRDFTVNALYYSSEDFSCIRLCVHGVQDLERRARSRIIGNPEKRYREDPVRMLRAVRFAAKLDFDIDDRTPPHPMTELAYLLEGVPAARLFDEMLKLFMAGNALATFRLLVKYQPAGPPVSGHRHRAGGVTPGPAPDRGGDGQHRSAHNRRQTGYPGLPAGSPAVAAHGAAEAAAGGSWAEDSLPALQEAAQSIISEQTSSHRGSTTFYPADAGDLGIPVAPAETQGQEPEGAGWRTAAFALPMTSCCCGRPPGRTWTVSVSSGPTCRKPCHPPHPVTRTNCAEEEAPRQAADGGGDVPASNEHQLYRTGQQPGRVARRISRLPSRPWKHCPARGCKQPFRRLVRE